MEALGTTLPVFIGLTVVVFGAAALLTGQALARGWSPAWKTLPYAALLTVGDRFLDFALFGGNARSPLGAIVVLAILWALVFVAHRVVQAGKMVQQYPWLYERAGPFAWRSRAGTAGR